jgi:DNA (cytosine-5)-methyltransferase 1
VFILAIKGEKNEAKLRAIADEVRTYRELEKGWNPDEWTLDDVIKPDSEFEPDRIAKFKVSKTEAKWLEAWDDFVKVIPAETLPGFPIWVDVFVKNKPLTAGFPEWKVEFIEKNHKFYLDHKEVIDDWIKEYDVRSFPPSRRKFEWQARKRHPKRKGRTIRDLVIQMRPSGIRVKPANYLPALVAITQTSIIGPAAAGNKVKDYRTLTPQEAAVLQGMPPDTFTKRGLIMPDAMAYKQLGNAVNVGVIRFLAERLVT